MSLGSTSAQSLTAILRGTLASIATAALIASTVCNTAMAVDGYKDFKFGLSPEQVIRKCPVPLEELSNAGFADNFGKDCRVLAADNFRMMDAEREVNFVFTKKGLVFVVFALQAHEFGGVVKSLGEKYPGATLHPSKAEFQQLAKRFDAGQPNTVIKITYDGDTVILVGTRDETGEASFLLMYKAPNAEQQEISKKGKDDL
jgi:hypothetical protein